MASLCLVVYYVAWDSRPVFDSIWDRWEAALGRVEQLSVKAGVSAADYKIVVHNEPGGEEILESEEEAP